MCRQDGVRLSLALLLLLLAGCVRWPLARGPSPAGGCVQVTVHGRGRHYWKNGREVARERLADALRDDAAAHDEALAWRRADRAASLTALVGWSLFLVGDVGIAVAAGVHDAHVGVE